MMGKDSNGRISEETFDDFLAGQGLLEDAEEIAIKRVLARQITEAMKAQGLTKTAMAALMRTDRRQLDRLLDPNNPVRHPQHLAPRGQRSRPEAARRIGVTFHEPGSRNLTLVGIPHPRLSVTSSLTSPARPASTALAE